jgi:amidase
VPSRGHVLFPPGWLSGPDVTVVGPLGRSAGDLELALGVLAVPTGEAAVAWRLQLPGPRHGTLTDYRVATWFDDPDAPVGDDVRVVLEDCAGTLAAAGAVVRPARPPVALADTVRLWERFVWSAPGLAPPPDLWEYACHVEASPEALGPETEDRRWARAVALRHRDWVALDEERHRLRSAYAEFFRRYDALLTPVMPIPAFPHLDRDVEDAASDTLDVDGTALPYWDATRWCAGFGALHLPAASVPAGRTRHGLPVGVQVVGPYLEDRTVIDMARHIERAVGPFRPPPGW